MRKISILVALVAVAVVAYSMSNLADSKTVVASNNLTIEKINVSDFTKIEVGQSFQVEVTYGSEESVSVEAPDNLQEYIDVDVKSGTLRINFDPKTTVKSSCAIKIHIKTAKLNDFDLSGAASVELINTLKYNDMTIEMEGAASFKGDVAITDAKIEMEGAASAKLSGTATTANLDLSGASSVNDYDFKVDNLNIDLSGASSTKITSLKSLNGDLSGASSLNYKGDPSIKRLNKSGAANVNKH